jgi:filamentous hemagglutinin
LSFLSAGGDIDISATRRIGLLGAVDSGFRLTDTAYAAFTEIGETLQLGTLMRDPTIAEATANSTTAGSSLLAFADSTQSYSLATAAISSGGNLSLSTGGDVVSFAGSIIAGENLYVIADGSIRNEALRTNFTLTDVNGCGGQACGQLGQNYKPAEILAGSGMLLTSGADIINYGSTIAAAGSLMADAQGDIKNTAITSQYLYYYVNTCSLFCLVREKKELYRAAINQGNISTEFGELTLNAGNDVLVEASMVSSGGNIDISAGRDVDLLAKAEELNNYYSKSGFGFLSYSTNTTVWNEFDTALSQIEGSNVSITAGRNLTGIGVSVLAADDIDLIAGQDLSFRCKQPVRTAVHRS